jgi:hypothetical protein
MAAINPQMAVQLQNNSFIQSIYKNTLKRMVALNLPMLSTQEIDKAIDYSMNKRYKPVESKVYNNYTEKTAVNTLAELTDYIYSREPICTAWGVMFKKHAVSINPLTKLIYMFMTNRDKEKKIMFQFPKGSEEFEEHNLLQLLAKVDTNAIYGALGNNACIFYNIHVAASITSQGRSYISAAIMFFEMFLSNNVKFGSLNEVVTFIDNVRMEAPKRHYDDREILDRNIEPIEVLSKLVLTCGDFRHGKIKWVPDQRDLDIIWEQLNNLSQEDLNRIYYKNNLYEFLNNTSMTRALMYILKSMTVPYLDPNKVPENIKVEMETFCDLLREYVFYDHQIIDRIDRNTNMIKNVSLISDTDSTIVSFDAFYNYTLQKIQQTGILPELEVAKYYVDGVSYMEDDENGNPTYRGVTYDDPIYDYDFFNKKVIEQERLINPLEIIPQDNLRYSIINIIGHCCGILCNEYIESHTKAGNSYDENRQTMMYLKNEFTFKRTLLTQVKKGYAAIQTVQEGNLVPDENMNDLAITGLPIKKSTLPKATRDELQKILYEDILKPDSIDQVKVIKDLAIFEDKIFQSLRSGDKSFYKPDSIKAIGRYDDPMRIQGIKASLVWNEVRDRDLEAIDLSAKNNIDIVKTNITLATIEGIKDQFPEEYDRLHKLLTDNSDLSKTLNGSIDTIAVPRNVKTPEWITHLINYKEITNDNIKNFPIESIGIMRLGKSNVNYSNIISL